MERIDAVPHWYHRIEVAPGLVTPGVNDSWTMLQRLPIADDLSGARVLDLGTRDGFFAFEMERRGAEVVAIDYMPVDRTGFGVARDLLGSDVEYVNANVYDLSAAVFGQFDLVLFLGLLYHLRDPLLALDRIWAVCAGQVIVETQVIDHALLLQDGSFATTDDLDPRLQHLSIMQFYPERSLNNDATNWWAPNTTCLGEMIRAAGFRVDHLVNYGPRSIARGVRTADPQVLFQRAIEKSPNIGDHQP